MNTLKEYAKFGLKVLVILTVYGAFIRPLLKKYLPPAASNYLP